jgi:hypothetical protein
MVCFSEEIVFICIYTYFFRFSLGVLIEFPEKNEQERSLSRFLFLNKRASEKRQSFVFYLV